MPMQDDEDHPPSTPWRVALATATPFALLAIGLVALAYLLLDPTPPKRVTMATGVAQGAYSEFGQRYAQRLKRHGIQVELRNTQGAAENLALLHDASSGVDLAFVQGGAGTSLRIVRDGLNEREGWNLCEIIVTNGMAVHLVNGKVVNRCADFRQVVAGEWQPLQQGKIALQLEGSEIAYRNLEIKEISR